MQSTKRTKGRRPIRQRGPRGQSSRAFVGVPDLDHSITMKKKLRYIPSQPSSITVTNQNFADFLAINVDNTVADTYRLCLAVRIVNISIYASPVMSAAGLGKPPLNHSIQYISSVAAAPFGGPSKLLSCVPLSPGNSVIHARPPPESYAAQWINCQNNVTAGAVDLVTITSAPGDVVDITYEFVVNTSSSQTLTSQTVAVLYPLAGGPIFALTLGGNPSAGLVPQQYQLYY